MSIWRAAARAFCLTLIPAPFILSSNPVFHSAGSRECALVDLKNAPRKVVLVHPAIANHGFDSYQTKTMETQWISHGLCSIAAVLREKNYEVELIDLRALANWEEFDKKVADSDAAMYGVNMMTVDFNPAVESAKRIKAVKPDALVVTGGPHPTLMLHEIIDNKDIDYIVTREGEITFPKLLEDLQNGATPERVLEGEAPDLDSLPFAARDIYPELETPLPVPGFDTPFVTVIAGRGCMYNCAFCMPAEKKIFGRKVRKRSPENLIAELEELRDKYQFKSLFIHDDCITEKRDWVREFCALYKDRGFTAPFACQSRADLICKNPDMIELMRDTGLHLFFIGFESGSDRILKFMRKGTTAAINEQAGQICKSLGIKIWANYMFGLPTETPEEMMATANMIRRIRPDWYSPAFFTPHPGSDLYDYCVENDLIAIQDHKNYARTPDSEKVKGIDYATARRAMEVSQYIPRHEWLLRKVKRYLNKRFGEQPA